MKLSERIIIDEHTRFGKPVIEGTRVPVELILGKLAGGMTYDEVSQEYEITIDDILAAIEYASRLVAGEEITLLENA